MQTLETLLSKYLSESMDRANTTEFPEQHAKYIAEKLREDGYVLLARWIPITERLPKRQDGDVFGTVIAAHVGVEGREDGVWTLHNYDIGTPGCIATHWMPLPKPPKEDNDGQR